jgi:hypothetical protein
LKSGTCGVNRPFAAFEIVSVQNWRLPAAIFNEHLSYVHGGWQVACHLISRPGDGIDLQWLAWGKQYASGAE